MLSWYRLTERAREAARLAFEGDEKRIVEQFTRSHGYPPDLENPKTWSEKIQWIKLHDRNPLYALCSDKYRVREFVRERVGEEHLVPLLGVVDDARKIDFDALPERFIVKANHGSGWNVMVRDRGACDRDALVRRLNKWLARSYYVNQREWQYKDIERRVVIEEILQDEAGRIPADYKIHCFRQGTGDVVLGVDSDRFGEHTRDHYDERWNRIDLTFKFPQSKRGVGRPERLDEMVRIARRLAEPFPYVRVDLYTLGGRIYVGELTFTPGSGYDRFVPESIDHEWGSRLILTGGPR